MIQELVELWSWFFGMVAGWGTTTIGMVIAIVVLYMRHARLSRRVETLYSRLVATERDWALMQKDRDRI